MIVALVMFIIVGLVLYLSRAAIKKQSEQSIKQIQGTPIEVQPIKEYVSACLDKLAKDGIILLGKQGGYIYASQGGTLVDFPSTDQGVSFIKYKEHDVAYNIYPPSFDSAPQIYSSIPEYPWPTFPYETADSTEEIFIGYFGMNNMPYLYSLQGPHSIQSQLETFIDNNIDNCLDFTAFEEQGFDIVMNKSKTRVTIGNIDLSVMTHLPLTITNPQNEVFQIEEFTTNVNVRLKEIYALVKSLVDEDVTNIRFDMKDPLNSHEFLNVNVVESMYVDEDSDDDIIIVTDLKSLIYGKPYEYIFARRNRAPALHYIKDNILYFPPNEEITQEKLLQGQELKAYDPDEDSYTFTLNPESAILIVPQLIFKVEVSDDKKLDYQEITVNRVET